MIEIARWLSASGILLLGAGIALAETPPPSARPEATTETPAAPRAATPPPTPKRANPAPRVTAATPECAWSGRRIINLLIRDDVDTADKHRRFYDQFGCPAEHVGPALRCVIQSEAPAQNPAPGSASQGQAQARALAERVEQCWDKPSLKFLTR